MIRQAERHKKRIRHWSGAERGERALGEDRAEMIRQAERNEKRIRHRPGAEHGRHDDVAHETGDAREQRQAADSEDAVDHVFIPPHLWGGIKIA